MFSPTANSSSSTFSACQKVDATGAVLGTGLTHIMSAAHLEARDTTFQHMHAGLIKYLSKEEEEEKSKDVMTATFHFLNLGRTLMTGMEPVGEIGVSVGNAGLGCILSIGWASVGHTGCYVGYLFVLIVCSLSD